MGFHIRQVKSILLSYKATQQSKMKNLAIALFSTLVAFSSASYWEAGPCPAKPEVVTPFDAERYLGNWYTVYETPMPYTTRENVCTMSQVGLLPQGMNNMRPTGDMMLYMGEIGVPSWIIDTDYETFAAGYA